MLPSTESFKDMIKVLVDHLSRLSQQKPDNLVCWLPAAFSKSRIAVLTAKASMEYAGSAALPERAEQSPQDDSGATSTVGVSPPSFEGIGFDHPKEVRHLLLATLTSMMVWL
jgi:hypothetical protein